MRDQSTGRFLPGPAQTPMTDAIREKIRQAKLGKPNPGGRYVRTDETRAKAAALHTGKRRSIESRQRMSAAHKATWQDPEYKAKYGRVAPPIITEEEREEREQQRRERVRAHNLGRKDSAERRAKVRAGLIAAYAARPELREKLREARLRQVFPRGQTSIERALESALRAAGLRRFLTQYPAFGRFQPDFTFPDAQLFVQADGAYWHSLPNNVRLDREFEAKAAEEGWTVMRFTQKEIDASSSRCADQVARFVSNVDRNTLKSIS